jgi:hypothetical protein
MQAQQQLLMAPVPRPADASSSPIAPYQQMHRYGGPQLPYRSNVELHFLLFALVISLIIVAAFLALGYTYSF